MGLNLVCRFVVSRGALSLWFDSTCIVWVDGFYLGNIVLRAFGCVCISIGPDIRQDYPLNLSILISGGKETNQDSPSNGE